MLQSMGSQRVRHDLVTEQQQQQQQQGNRKGTWYLELGTNLIRLIVQEEHVNRWSRFSGEGGSATIRRS